ncbi:hypothetical protein BG000_007751 [Podila horticola]|nr:hypothetical protein BG000_007751 [Podila horticola]
MANIQYYYSIFEIDIEKPNNAGIKDPMSGLDQSQMQKEIHDLQEQIPEWDLQNIYHNMLHLDDSWRRYDTSSLLIILPSDLNSLQRQQEFIQEYGDYVLRLLQMIKSGYTDDQYVILPLDADKILWNCDPSVINSHITKDTIAPLVEKTIAYLQELSPPQARNPAPTGDQAAAIKNFLDLEGDGANSNLIRCIASDHQVHWMCQEHAHQHVDQGCLQELQVFVSCHGGHVDMQQATLSVELGSTSEADEFRRLLTGTKYAFDVSLKMRWKATRLYMVDLCRDIGSTNAVVLEIDGVTADMQPRGHVQYSKDIFCDKILQEPRNFFLAITLLNYPQPQEQCLCFRRIALQSPLTPVLNPHRLEFLRHDLRKFIDMVEFANSTTDLTTATGKLSEMLVKHGRSDATMITIYNSMWSGVVDLKKGTLVEVYSVDTYCSRLVLSSGSLKRITLYVYDMAVDQDLFRMVLANAELEELNIAYDAYNGLHSIEEIFRLWHDASSPFLLTVIDRMLDSEGRIEARMTIRGATRDLADVRGGEEKLPPIYHQQSRHARRDIEILQWHCDGIFGRLSDYAASFLDMATQQHPSILTSFSLDITGCSADCLVSIQNMISRSSLEYLVVECAPFDSALSDSIAQVLHSIPWSTLKSLVLTGHNMDEWIQLWSCPVAPSLLCLQIRGTGSVTQALSHSSIIFVHGMVLTSLLMELHLDNIQLNNKRDWELLVESMDSSIDVDVRNCAHEWPRKQIVDSGTLEE